jgi:hypothetical protein
VEIDATAMLKLHLPLPVAVFFSLIISGIIRFFSGYLPHRLIPLKIYQLDGDATVLLGSRNLANDPRPTMLPQSGVA